MQLLTNHQNNQHGRWCVVVILVTVCSLAIHVATRYCSSENSSAYSVKTLHKQSLETSRQRLTKDAASWMPPVVCAVALQAPAAYPHLAPAGPSIADFAFDKSRYNRPPPYSQNLA